MKKKQKGYRVYAVATRQHDGRWYPWSNTFGMTRRETIERYAKSHGAINPKPDFGVKRFLVTAS